MSVLSCVKYGSHLAKLQELGMQLKKTTIQ